MVYQRPADYRERRSDGYQEPLELFVLGTAHLSTKSAEDVARVVQVRAAPGACAAGRCALAGRLDGAAGRAIRHLPSATCRWPADGLPPPPPQAVRPENVVVELCKSRVAVMGGEERQQQQAGGQQQQQQQQQRGGGKWSNPLNLSGGGFLEVAARSLNLGGQSGLLLRLLLAGQAERAASEWRREGARAAARLRAPARVPPARVCAAASRRCAPAE